jgi:rubrerythrin
MNDHPDFVSAAGALTSVRELDVPALRLLFRVECSGEVFYDLLADRLGSPAAADLLRRNAREERGHAERVRKVLGLKQGATWEPPAEDLELYPVHLPPTVSVDLLPLIVQAELDGDRGYQQWADRESDPEVQRLLRLNGHEETGHGERVQRVIEILHEERPGGR